MEYRRLGTSGLKLSALSFGSWVTFGHQLGGHDVEKFLKTAYDAGVNFFDNAESYARGQSEILMGEALRSLGWPRDSYCVSSKAYFGATDKPSPTQRGLSRKHLTDACHAALRRLRVDYLDLYFCHRPDPETPIEETVRAMHDLVSQGKVLYWGTSEWPAEDILAAHRIAEARNLTPPTMEQPQYNMIERARVEAEYAPLYEKVGLGTTIWSPLAIGLLAGRYNDGVPRDARVNVKGYEWLRDRVTGPQGALWIAKVAELSRLANRLGTSMAVMAVAWCLKNPHVSTVILGASRIEQLRENLKAIDIAPRLTPDVMAEIEHVLDNKP